MLPDRNNLVRVRANFAGTVELKVRVGQAVERATPLVVVEGDTEIETLSAREPGTVVEVLVADGADVVQHQTLVVVATR